MQDQSSTGTHEAVSGKIADKNLAGNIGPFNETEIQSVARKCVEDLGINWDELSQRAKNQYIEVARDTLLNKTSGEHLSGLIGGTSGGMREFRRSILTEFRNSPNWDEDLFVAGWKDDQSGIGTGGTDTTGG
jgi:hypothetical protein